MDMHTIAAVAARRRRQAIWGMQTGVVEATDNG